MTTGTGTLVGVRWHEEDLNAIERWSKHQEDKPERSEAIRRLVRLGLKSGC